MRKLVLLVVLLPALALGASDLPGTKIDGVTTMPAAEFNALVAALPGVDIGSYGATTGSADNKAAIQAAITTGKSVRCRGGTYVTEGGITASTAGQVLDFSGCVLKLKNAATNKVLLTLSGAGSSLVGGEIDMNAANNTAGVDAAPGDYATVAVQIAATKVTVRNTYIHGSHGIGIGGSPLVHYALVEHNRLEDVRSIGIFFDGAPSDTVDTVGIRVRFNHIDTTASAASGAKGIQLASYVNDSPYFPYRQRYWDVSHNTMIGNAASTDDGMGGGFAITVRGSDGIVGYNIFTGWTCHVSLDWQGGPINSLIIGNHGTGLNGGTQYGYEGNNSGVRWVDNYEDGGKYAISASVSASMTHADLDDLFVSGNVFVNQTENAIQIYGESGNTRSFARMRLRNNVLRNAVNKPLVQLIPNNANLTGFSSEGDTFHGNRASLGAGGYAVRGIQVEGTPGGLRVFGSTFIDIDTPVMLSTDSAVPGVVFLNNDVSDAVISHGSTCGTAGTESVQINGSGSCAASSKLTPNFDGT